MKLALALACTATALAACASTTTRPAAVSYGPITFAEADLYPSQIYTVNLQGKQRHRLTRGNSLSYSPDGKKIVFVSAPSRNQDELATMNADGSDPRTVLSRSEFIADPAWSPDGAAIAFAVKRPKAQAGIWIVKANGMHRRRLTGGAAESPSWSPDGTEIAFDAGDNLWTVAASGGTPRLVKSFPDYSDTGPYAGYDPAWSPDGTRLAFDGLVGELGQRDILVLDLDSGKVTNLTGSEDEDEMDPAWSPHGRKIVFAVLAGEPSDFSGIGTVSSTGGHYHLITHDCPTHCSTFFSSPSWQPVSG